MNKRGIFLLVVLILSVIQPIETVQAECPPMPPTYDDACHGYGGSCRGLIEGFGACMETCLAKRSAAFEARDAVRKCLSEKAERETETVAPTILPGGHIIPGFEAGCVGPNCLPLAAPDDLKDSLNEEKLYSLEKGVLEIEELGLKCDGVKIGGTVSHSGGKVTAINMVIGEGGSCTIGSQKAENLPEGSKLVFENGKVVIRKPKDIIKPKVITEADIKNQIKEALAKGDIAEAMALVNENQALSGELNLDAEGKLKLAGIYSALGRSYESLSEYNEVIEDAERVLKESEDPRELDIARSRKAAALFNTGRYDEAIKEYKELAKSGDKNMATTGQLNLALLKTQGNQKERGEAIFDFENLEKLAREINDPALEKFAHRTARNMKVEMRDEYLRKAREGDKNAEALAVKLTTDLKLSKNEIDDVIDSYQDNLDNLYGGNVPEKARRELVDYAEYLETISANPRYLTMTKTEMEDVRRAALNLEIDEVSSSFKDLYEERVAGTNDYLARKRIENEIIQNVPQITELQKLIDKTKGERNSASSSGDENLVKLKNYQVLRYEAELGKWKKAITGNEEYDLYIMNGEILDAQVKSAELEETIPWYAKPLMKKGGIAYFPLLGSLISDEAKQKKVSDEKADELRAKWEEERIRIDVKTGSITTRYNPNSGEEETLVGTIQAQETREWTKWKNNAEKIRDGAVEAELLLASMGAAEVAVGLTRVGLAGRTALASQKAARIAKGGATTLKQLNAFDKFLTAEKGAWVLTRSAGQTVIEGTSFHFTNEAGQVLAYEGYEALGKKFEGQGFEGSKVGKTIDQVNYNPTGAIATFGVLKVLGSAEIAIVRRIPIMKTVAGQKVNTLLINPNVQAAGMTIGASPSILLSDVPPEQKIEHLIETYVEGLKFALVMNVNHMHSAMRASQKAKIYGPYQKEILEYQKNIETYSKEVVGTKGKKGIFGDPNNYVGGKITPEAKFTPEARQKIIELDIKINQQHKAINDVQKIAHKDISSQIGNKEISLGNIPELLGMKSRNPQKILNKIDGFKIQAERKSIDYKEKLLMEMQKNPIATEKDLLLNSKELRTFAKESIKAKEKYIKELDSNKKKLAFSGQFDAQSFGEIKNKLKNENKKIKDLEKIAKKLDKANKKIKNAKEKQDELIEKAPSKIRSALEILRLDRQGKHEEALQAFERTGKKITVQERLPAPETTSITRAQERIAIEKAQTRNKAEIDSINRAVEELVKSAEKSKCG